MPYRAADAVSFAQRQSGRYRDGECWTLVEDSIVGAGGRSSRGLTPGFGPSSSYVWGTTTLIGALQAGDAIQFQNYVWEQTTTVDVTNPDGSGTTDTQTKREERGQPHHSALVVSVVSPGLVEVIEQNVPRNTGGVQTVQLRLMIAPPSTTTTRTPDGTGFITTVTTVTHLVTGTVRCYRPISA